MTISENVSLKNYSTMRLGGNARYLCEIHTENDLLQALEFATNNNLKFKVIGSGSNLIWPDNGFDGLVIVNKIENFKIDGTQVEIGAGEDWDSVVEKTVNNNLSGIEFLSLIPGSTGATPVQNVGAYGCEIKDVLVSLRAYDTEQNQIVEITNVECGFGYRSSRFNGVDSGRFIITSIKLQLSSDNPAPPFYDSLQKYFELNNISTYSPQAIREAVISVRTAKLPDPDYVANNGSFFSNPIIDSTDFENIKIVFPEIVGWPFEDGIKVSAAWLIENSGFKDFHDAETGLATWATQPLVIINEHANSTADLVKFRDKIIKAVYDKFRILLQQEPELVE